MEVPGKRRRGRPKRRWLDNIKNDLSERELSGEEAQHRVQWRRLETHQPHIEVGKDAKEEEMYFDYFEDGLHNYYYLRCFVPFITSRPYMKININSNMFARIGLTSVLIIGVGPITAS